MSILANLAFEITIFYALILGYFIFLSFYLLLIFK